MEKQQQSYWLVHGFCCSFFSFSAQQLRAAFSGGSGKIK
jgi:hypothetical protein